jgi:hypothetical protein
MMKVVTFSVLFIASALSVASAFTTTTTTTTVLRSTTGSSHYYRGLAPLAASSMDNGDTPPLFKAGLLANVETEAAALASQKIRSVQDLGWKGPAKRSGNTRPRHWAFGGAGEKAVQDKPNYDPANPLCVETWLSLPDFYAIVKDDTAVADTIFVALAKGGAYVERDVAEGVIARWRGSSGGTSTSTTAADAVSTKKGGMFGRKAGGAASSAAKFEEQAFLKTVQEGRQDFLLGWAVFGFITGTAVLGIVAPTNPLQLALVDLLEAATGSDVSIPASP